MICKNEEKCDEIAERSFNYLIDNYLKKLEEEYFIEEEEVVDNEIR